MFGHILQKFSEKSPVTVMVQGLLERLLHGNFSLSAGKPKINNLKLPLDRILVFVDGFNRLIFIETQNPLVD